MFPFDAIRRRFTQRRRLHRTTRFHLSTIWALLLTAVGVLGLLVYNITPRTLTEPIATELSVSDEGFCGYAGPLLRAEYTTGNRIKPLLNGDEIFPAMLEAIRGAKHSITLESYIWASGKVSDEFCDALIERAKHGVKVHALVDGAGDFKLKLSDMERMKDAGVEFVVYGREHWYDLKLNINHRTHRKLLVVDGQVGFTGGVCIDDTWLGDADRPDVWRDTQAQVTGPMVRQMQAVFAANWLQTTGDLLTGPDYFPEIKSSGHATANCFMSGPNENPENARLAYLLAIASARRSIDISHAYFVPDDLTVRMLVDARKRGVHIRVIVPAKSDSDFGRAVSRSRWKPLMDAGVEFHRYTPSLYHCKMMIVDGIFTTLGSVNFDNRSFSINDEVNITVVDRDTTESFQKAFDGDLELSEAYTREAFESRPVYIKAVDQFCGLFRTLF